MNSSILREGIKIFNRNIKVKISGFKKYSGTDMEICRKIIFDCYNREKQCFMASHGNYKVFYSRDFGWCIESLLNLGYKIEVENTLKYVMNVYSKNGKITVAINDKDRPYNFPNVYSPDSVAYLYRSLRIAKSKNLVKEHQEFLNDQIRIFEREVLDKSGTLRKKHFSGMRDYINNTNLCYDMIMACMLCDEIDRINKMMEKIFISNVLKKYDLKNQLIKQYWNGKYFNDSLEDKYCSGHANTYPYFLNVIADKGMLRLSLWSIQDHKLDKPFPLKYGHSAKTKFIWSEVFVKNWEKNTVWAMLGLAYIEVLSRIDKSKALEHLEQYKQNILRNHCFIELYSENKPYKSLFYSADDSMLWASMYLNLKNKLSK
jgi:hypothetical protein